MVPEASVLVALVRLVDQVPLPPRRRRRGRPVVYSDRLFLKALVIMLVRRLARVHTLLAVLDQPTAEMQQLRALLCEQGRYPTRRTWERRLRAIPNTLPAQIGCPGRYRVDELALWAAESPLAALDSTPCGRWAASGTRRIGRRASSPTAPLTRRPIGPSSGWHGWVYG